MQGVDVRDWWHLHQELRATLKTRFLPRSMLSAVFLEEAVPRAMILIEILLPLANNDGRRFGGDFYAKVRETLTNTFGGLTEFASVPGQRHR